jgi:hypothetical protein
MSVKKQGLVVVTSAVSAAAVDVLVVAAARRLHRAVAGTRPPGGASRTTRWAHLLLTEALAELQAELVTRQLRASVAVERAIERQAQANRQGQVDRQPKVAAGIPAQRNPRVVIPAPAEPPGGRGD